MAFMVVRVWRDKSHICDSTLRLFGSDEEYRTLCGRHLLRSFGWCKASGDPILLLDTVEFGKCKSCWRRFEANRKSSISTLLNANRPESKAQDIRPDVQSTDAPSTSEAEDYRAPRSKSAAEIRDRARLEELRGSIDPLEAAWIHRVINEYYLKGRKFQIKNAETTRERGYAAMGLLTAMTFMDDPQPLEFRHRRD